jgi:hypothetical protein
MTGKKNPIHGLRRRAFYERKWLVEAVAAGPPFIGATYTAYKAWYASNAPVDPGATIAATSGVDPIILGGACAWLLLASVIKVLAAKAQDTKEDLAKGHDGLLATLHVVYSVVAHQGKLTTPEQRKSLRVTFHRVLPPLENSEHIEHIVPYVGGSGSEPGRKFSIRSGITGRAIREKAVFVMSRQNEKYEDYMDELVREWSYTEADAKKMTTDRFSAMAVPVRGRGQDVLGVVYLDCSSKDFFASDEMQQAVVAACVGVTDYIGERYD